LSKAHTKDAASINTFHIYIYGRVGYYTSTSNRDTEKDNSNVYIQNTNVSLYSYINLMHAS
jgi:hypothetical protein